MKWMTSIFTSASVNEVQLHNIWKNSQQSVIDFLRRQKWPWLLFFKTSWKLMFFWENRAEKSFTLLDGTIIIVCQKLTFRNCGLCISSEIWNVLWAIKIRISLTKPHSRKFEYIASKSYWNTFLLTFNTVEVWMCNNKIKLILMKHKRKSCHHKENGISFIRDIMKKETKEAKCDKAKL